MKRRSAQELQQKTEDLGKATNDLNDVIKEIDALYDAGDYETCLNKCLEAEIKHAHSRVNIWYTKALCLSNLKKKDDAKAIIETILSIDPTHIGARSWLASDEFDSIFSDKSNKLTPGLLKRIEDYAYNIAQNTQLIASVNKMCQSLDGLLNLQFTLDYQKNLKEELKKKNQDKSYQIDFDRLRTQLDGILSISKNKEELKGLEKAAKDLRQENPEDYTKFHKLFSYLTN